MQYLKNVVTLTLNEDLCTACGMCAIVCPHAVFEINNKKAHIVNRDNCMECGACALNCKYDAIEVKSGVGCADAILNGYLKGTEASCDCGDTSCC